MNPLGRVCAKCGADWEDGQRECRHCGYMMSQAKPDPFARSKPTAAQPYEPSWRTPAVAPTAVTVTDVRLSWTAAFDIAIKFSVIFLVGQLALVLLAYALFR
jgi:rubredoxin